MKAKYLNVKWQKSMRLKMDYNNMTDEFVGREQGISAAEIRAKKDLALSAYERVQA